LARAYAGKGFDGKRFAKDITVPANEYGPPRLYFALAAFREPPNALDRYLLEMFDSAEANVKLHGYSVVFRPSEDGPSRIPQIDPVPIPTWPPDERRGWADG
jgi:hypothetical protein